MTRLVFDIDSILYDAASAVEDRFITAMHVPTGKVMELANRTELYGSWRKKDGGFIAAQNELLGSVVYKADDFEIVDGQRLKEFTVTKGYGGSNVKPFSALSCAKNIIDKKISDICEKLNCYDYFGYTGTGDTFRTELATLLPYKGQRSTMRPLLLSELKQYVIDRHHCEMVTYLEADDVVSIATVEGYKKWKKSRDDKDMVIACGVDKDMKQVEGWLYNISKDDGPYLIEGFGSLWLDEKGDVDGGGRVFLYWQMLSGDQADNYKANCFSDVTYGEKAAYKDLKDCTNDKQAFEAMVRVFKRMYPEPKVITGCKGEVKINWYFVMNEMFQLARMLRWKDDSVDLKDVLTKMGISHE
jgi:hypothetical protein